MNAPLYLDHAATTPPLPAAIEAFLKAQREAFANPSSLHQAGAEAARCLERARNELRTALGASRYRVIWTGTGTESNHLGILGLAPRLKSKVRREARRLGREQPRILVGNLEHPSAGMAAQSLQEEGFVVQTVAANREGRILPERLAESLAADVALVCIQWANNELGSLQPIPALVALTRKLAPKAAFHVDAVQAAGKLSQDVDALAADSVAVAAHKLGGVRGCAALLLHEEAPEPRPLFHGGGHEGGLRSGTENTAGAAAFAAAAVERRLRLAEDPERYHKRRQALLDGLTQAQVEAHPLGPADPEQFLPSILSVALPGMPAETLLHRLEAQGYWVGSGSACHAGGHKESAILTAIDCPRAWRNAVLRFSFDGSEDLAALGELGSVIAGIFAEQGGQTADSSSPSS
ncbi:MAG: aminotransferase class V-fold PLP-dependent enzyme [Planctomycetota bacterium]|nr:MAG: aminotransferase class V-fold PLP-dependent enzyme [Planctomycetota bacterium]